MLPEALSEYLPSSFPPLLSTCILELRLFIVVLTEPEIGPSWADFPLTLKLYQDQIGDAKGSSSLHHAVGCFRLDFEVGRSSVIEVLV